jgi:hypothetical protein
MSPRLKPSINPATIDLYIAELFRPLSPPKLGTLNGRNSLNAVILPRSKSPRMGGLGGISRLKRSYEDLCVHGSIHSGVLVCMVGKTLNLSDSTIRIVP